MYMVCLLLQPTEFDIPDIENPTLESILNEVGLNLFKPFSLHFEIIIIKMYFVKLVT